MYGKGRASRGRGIPGPPPSQPTQAQCEGLLMETEAIY